MLLPVRLQGFLNETSKVTVTLIMHNESTINNVIILGGKNILKDERLKDIDPDNIIGIDFGFMKFILSKKQNEGENVLG